jgi:hypothetical protein
MDLQQQLAQYKSQSENLNIPSQSNENILTQADLNTKMDNILEDLIKSTTAIGPKIFGTNALPGINNIDWDDYAKQLHANRSTPEGEKDFRRRLLESPEIIANINKAAGK